MNLTKRGCLIVLMTLFVGAGTSLAQNRIQLAQGKRVFQDKVSFVIDVAHDKAENPRYAEAPDNMHVWMRFSDHVVSGKVYVDGKAIGRFDETMQFLSNPIDITYGRHTITLTVSGSATLYDLYVDLHGGVAHEILDDQDLVAPPPSPALSKRVADLELKVHDLEAEIATLKKKQNH